MKTTKQKIVTCVILIASLVLVLSGCFDNSKPEVEPLEKGFEFYVGESIESITVGIRSDDKEKMYQLDDVTLDFYYGFYDGKIVNEQGYAFLNGFDELISLVEADERYQCLSVAVYFVQQTSQEIIIKFEDYKNLDGFYFVKEISIDDFRSDVYKVTVAYSDKFLSSTREVSFAFSEKLTVPQEIFYENDVLLSKGFFGLFVNVVVYDNVDKAYRFIDVVPIFSHTVLGSNYQRVMFTASGNENILLS
jgi:hypothetical protein